MAAGVASVPCSGRSQDEPGYDEIQEPRMGVLTRRPADAQQVRRLSKEVQAELRTKVKPALLGAPFWGDRIRRTLWPKRFQHLPNLFHFELQAPSPCRVMKAGSLYARV